MHSRPTSRRRFRCRQGRRIGAAALALALWLGALAPAQAGPADAAHVALREAATWAACIDQKILDADLDAELVDLSALAHIDSHFLRQTGRRAFDWTPLDAASYRQLGLAMLRSADAADRAGCCAQAKRRTLRFLGEPPVGPARRAKGA